MSIVPSSLAVGKPESEPAPAVEATMLSAGSSALTPLALLAPPPPRRPARSWRILLLGFAPFCAAVRSSSWPTPELALLVPTLAAFDSPMKTAMLAAASIGPLPWVRPNGPHSPDSISLSRMMAVSACEPQPLDEQSRGVPSATVVREGFLGQRMPMFLGIRSCHIPDRPGISTPLAPVILVTTPWAEA